MTSSRSRDRAFSLLELLLAMALFMMAAVSLAEAISMISLTVSESIEEAEIREKLRSELLLATRSPIRNQETRTTEPDEAGVFFKIDIERASLQNQDGETLDDLFEVTVTALRKGERKGQDMIDSVSSLVYPAIFSVQ